MPAEAVSCSVVDGRIYQLRGHQGTVTASNKKCGAGWSWVAVAVPGSHEANRLPLAFCVTYSLKDFHFLDVRMTPLLQAYNCVRQKDRWTARGALCQWNLPSTARKPQLPKRPHPQTLPHPTDWKLVTKLSGSLERETCDFARFGFYQKRRDRIPG